MRPLGQRSLGFDAKKVSVASKPKPLCLKGHNWEPFFSQCGLKSTIFIDFGFPFKNLLLEKKQASDGMNSWSYPCNKLNIKFSPLKFLLISISIFSVKKVAEPCDWREIVIGNVFSYRIFNIKYVDAKNTSWILLINFISWNSHHLRYKSFEMENA